MALADLVSREVVKVPLVSRTKDELIRELVQILKDAGRIADADAVCRGVFERESLGSTGLEKGIAVPHAKTPAVADLCIAIGISPGGVDFDSLDGEPSALFFLILAPPDKSGPHIQALTEIAGISRSNIILKALKGAKTADEVVSLFREDL
jgi:mannitol/fructose-specific phosphotransferase system IIA component (Ntr-type)